MRRSLQLLNLAVAAGLIAVVVAVYRPWEVWSFEISFFGALATALVLEVLLVLVWANRHSLVLREAGAAIPARKLLWLVTFSGTANSLTPAATGEVARAWLLHRNFGVAVEQSAGAILFERVFMFGFMALTALSAGLIASGGTGWLSALGGGAVIVYVVGTPSLVGLLAPRQPTSDESSVRNRIRSVLARASDVWSNRRATLLTALWSAAAFAIMGTIFKIAADRVGLELDAMTVWALVGGATAAGVLSALPFGLGAAELSAVGIGALIGLDTQAVAAAFVMYRILFTLPIAVAGSVAYGRLMLSDGSSST